MRIPPVVHPDGEALLRYADGESPARQAREIRSHLEACWQCRAELEELQKTVGECVCYRKNVLERHLPPPPAPWTDIYRGFAEVDAALDQAGFWDRIAWALRSPLSSGKRWAPVAVTLILVVSVVFYRFRQTPSVQAAELLRKAIAAADGRPEKPRRIRIRTRDRSLTRIAGSAPRLVSSEPDAGALQSLQALFQAAHYDWQDPLSAKSYQAWRDQLAEKRDEVIEGPDAYRIRTRAGSGELTAATLTIRRQDLRPVAERLEFRNQEWVEIAALAEDAAPAPGAIAAAAASPAVTQVKSMPARSLNAGMATIGDQLRVLAALHQVGADLGDPVEVSRTNGEILVAGVGIAPQRQQEISDALRSQAHVVVRFSDSAADTVQPEKEAAADTTVNADLLRLQARVAEQIGGRAIFAQLAGQVLDLSEPMMARAYALRRLAEQFPVEVESDLSVPERQLLRSLQREHAEALRRQTAEIDRLLRPALLPVSGASRDEPDGATSSGPWQPAAEELFQSARRVEKLLAVMFGAATGETAGGPLPSQLLSNLAQLRAGAEAYERRNQ